MKVRAFRTLAFVTVAAFAAACSDSTAPARQPADLGAVLTEMSVPPVAAALVPAMPATPTASALTPSSCSYDATSQRFYCPGVTVSGLTFTRSFALLDAAGRVQTQFDASTTDAENLNTSLMGNFTANGSTVGVAGNENLTLRGLLSGVHTLAGTSLVNVTGTDARSGAPYILSVTSTVDDLVLPDSPADKWPKSGSVTIDATHALAGTTTTSHLSATFNGTSKANVSLTSGGITVSCIVDLALPHPACGG
jgi:hypothetical protein